MPTKQQKKNDKAEQRETEKQKQKQLLEEEQSWEKGTNKRALSKIQQQNEKQEEKMRNAREMKELLAAEEQFLGPSKKSKSKKKSDDFELLKTLANIPKSKAQIEREEKLKKKEEQRKLEEQKKLEKDELLQKQQEKERRLLQKGIVDNSDIYFPIQNNDEEFDCVSSIDNALDLLNEDEQDPKVKDIFKEFYKTQFQILKEENPGLRLNQYKERIYKLWKRSSENPYSNK